MERYQVILAYDGSEFQGFQRQSNTRTVQGVFEDALRRLGWQGQKLLAAGRTDAGVHASGQVVAFDLAWTHSEQTLVHALNAHLPTDIAVSSVRRVPASFHPRYSAAWRKYRFQVTCLEIRHPLLERYAWRVWPAVELAWLEQTAACLIGTHDFAAFGAPLKRPPNARSSTVRTIFQAGWTEQPPFLAFEVTANAFLYHMVRRLVHVQVMIAQGLLSIEGLGIALGTPGQTGAAPQMPVIHGLAPAQGLTLIEVYYPPEALSGEG